MMKWDYQVERQTRSWRTSIHSQRREVLELLEQNPSYAGCIAEAVASAYRRVPFAIEDETGIPANRLPASCPYDRDTIMRRPHDLEPDRQWPN